mmetsp:Transcript_4842/g.13466  ORF Transcript_4842/g.13466 Transcript_4842/m.13466 type:complete len:578 (-) Transcript_4842:80-1813(-)
MRPRSFAAAILAAVAVGAWPPAPTSAEPVVPDQWAEVGASAEDNVACRPTDAGGLRLCDAADEALSLRQLRGELRPSLAADSGGKAAVVGEVEVISAARDHRQGGDALARRALPLSRIRLGGVTLAQIVGDAGASAALSHLGALASAAAANGGAGRGGTEEGSGPGGARKRAGESGGTSAGLVLVPGVRFVAAPVAAVQRLAEAVGAAGAGVGGGAQIDCSGVESMPALELLAAAPAGEMVRLRLEGRHFAARLHGRCFLAVIPLREPSPWVVGIDSGVIDGSLLERSSWPSWPWVAANESEAAASPAANGSNSSSDWVLPQIHWPWGGKDAGHAAEQPANTSANASSSRSRWALPKIQWPWGGGSSSPTNATQGSKSAARSWSLPKITWPWAAPDEAAPQAMGASPSNATAGQESGGGSQEEAAASEARTDGGGWTMPSFAWPWGGGGGGNISESSMRPTDNGTADNAGGGSAWLRWPHVDWPWHSSGSNSTSAGNASAWGAPSSKNVCEACTTAVDVAAGGGSSAACAAACGAVGAPPYICGSMCFAVEKRLCEGDDSGSASCADRTCGMFRACG